MSRYAPYAWLATSDPGKDVAGPRNADPELLAMLTAGHGHVFRTRDADRHVMHVMHTGRYVSREDLPAGDPGRGEVDGECEFGPLDDYSRAAGAVEIQYQQPDGSWKVL